MDVKPFPRHAVFQLYMRWCVNRHCATRGGLSSKYMKRAFILPKLIDSFSTLSILDKPTLNEMPSHSEVAMCQHLLSWLPGSFRLGVGWQCASWQCR